MNHQKTDCIRIFSDASIRNGKTGLGYQLKIRENLHNGTKEIDSGCKTIDEKWNTADAEYRAMVYATKKALEYDADDAVLFTDCQSVVHRIDNQEDVCPSLQLRNRLESNLRRYNKWKVFVCNRSVNETAHTQSRIASQREGTLLP